MSPRICRQVLDCGDGVREVTAFGSDNAVLSGWDGKAPSSKSQAPKKLQVSNPRGFPGQLGLHATAEPLSSMRGRSFWSLVLGVSLGFGAWDLELCKIPKRAADTATPTQSGDSADSVAAVQDARAPTRAALGSWSQCALKKA
jgi:hypothetical protein